MDNGSLPYLPDRYWDMMDLYLRMFSDSTVIIPSKTNSMKVLYQLSNDRMKVLYEPSTSFNNKTKDSPTRFISPTPPICPLRAQLCPLLALNGTSQLRGF